MKKALQISKSEWISMGVILALAVILRLIPHPPNFSPISALAIFGGAFVAARLRVIGFILPLAALILSDIVLGMHATMPFVYAGILTVGLVSALIRKHQTKDRILAFSLLGSTVFFIVSNLGVWFVGGLYPLTFAGLSECFMMAIPFFHWTVLGDFLFLAGFVFAFRKTAQLAYLRSLR